MSNVKVEFQKKILLVVDLTEREAQELHAFIFRNLEPQSRGPLTDVQFRGQQIAGEISHKLHNLLS